MSSSTEPTAKTDLPTTGHPGSGFTPPGHSTTARVGSQKSLPSSRPGGGKLVPFAIGLVMLLVVFGAAGWWFFLRPAAARADILLHKVKREPLVVTVTEKGTLESADNRDIVCKVRAGTKGYASTINWVIEDGARVKPGQLLMILDDSALKDQEDDQTIKMQTATANKVKAEKDYEIAVTQNKLNIATAESALITATNDLNNYTGVTYDSSRAALAAVGGGPLSLVEAGTFRQSVDDLTGQVRLAEAEVEQNRERSAWADRMVKLNFMSAAQAQSDRSKLDSSIEKARSLKAKLTQLLNSDRDQTLTKLVLAREQALLTLEKVKLEAEANLVKFAAEKQRATSEYLQTDERLREIVAQRAECKVVAPDTIEPDSMVVYFKSESSRWSQNQQGMIEQGAQVKEGQKMLRIPNLRRMQVNTKVHEAMVARIRGDVRVPTHFVESVQALMLLNTDPFTRLVSQKSEITDRLRERFRNESYRKISEGQKASIRVDALGDRVFEGHVRVKATVASQTDSWISDVKLYQTLVMVDHEVLPDGTKKPITNEELTPDMTAEVTITVDTAKEPVLTVPVQAVMSGAELGNKREVFVKTPTGYERREVKLGIFNEKVIEVREGLQEGEEVVLNPKVLLAPDDKTMTREEGGKNGTKGAKGEGDYPKGEGGGMPPMGPKGDGSGAPGGPGGFTPGGTKGGGKGGGKKGFGGGMPPAGLPPGGGAPPQ
jgi:multidrug efflux pump subunit AcrA (membrane-fusion protein)